MNYAKTTIIGRLAADPEIRTTTSGATMVTFRVGVTDQWKDRNTGETQSRTEWYSVVRHKASDNFVSFIEEAWKKGSLVFIEGQMQTRKWQDREGNERYSTELIARELSLLAQPKGEGSARRSSSRAAPQKAVGSDVSPSDFEDTDLPF